ncbi:transglycosylase family protein [Streptomyces sp. H10-C2]|uniref:transglycosylase family protein n=1 Tax=unclassified Streptomyces TaxID=2593676 RepID=UPI0024B98A84|nr:MULTISPECIES: transglycosylase family protein [unclassified Streptomyces]MDJ0341319.1 transglycosylase family protein [Streptomyces sp. PH10-H1]MDJ0370914.1 transglycosylase family protein [Streptomyces sp. H10-C2]
MLKSGNGRHRRPSQASTAIVVVAVTGAGIALPLLGAGAAQAADATTWDKVAVCESGGMWSANVGNGFYGGLSITKDTWEQYGGTVYAARPDLASRSQQIAVAETLLSALGPDAWPGCSVAAGLVQGGATPSVDPGASMPVTPAPSAPASPTTPAVPTSPSTPTSPTASPTAGPSGAAKPTGAPATPSSPATTPAPGQSQGKHAKPVAPDPTGTDTPGRASRDAQRGAGVVDGGRPGGVQSDGEYIVVPGDNLSAIAAAHHLPGGWTALYGANDRIVGANPDLILPGQHLNLSY